MPLSSMDVNALTLLDEENLGEVVTINVEGQRPVTISSDYLQNQDFPVYVFLKGATLGSLLFGESESSGAPFYGGIKIKRVIITPSNASSRFISGTPQYVLPDGNEYLVDSSGIFDMGYLIVNLRRSMSEEDLPETINLNMSARIYFDTETGFGGILGAQDINLGLNSNEDAWKENPTAQSNSRFWNGKGYVRAIAVEEDYATVAIYDGSHRPILPSVKLKLGEEPQTFSLPGASSIFGDQARIKLNFLIGSKNSATFLIKQGTSEPYELELVEGMRAFIGSEWELKELLNTKAIFVDSKGNTRELNLEDVAQTVTTPCDNVEDVSDSEISFATKKELACATINEYKNTIEYGKSINPSTSESNVILVDAYTKVSDVYKDMGAYALANENLQKAQEIQTTITGSSAVADLFDILNSNGKTVPLDSGTTITLLDINPSEESASADIRIGNGNYVPKKVGDSVLINIQDGSKIYDWIITSIGTEKVRLKKQYNDGTWGGSIGLNRGLNNVGGVDIYLQNIDTKKRAIVTVMPGSGRAFSESNFMVHLPIEKRAIQWTPEEVDDKIASTTETIEKLDDKIDKLESLVKGWKVACMSVFAFLTVKNSFFGNPIARQLVMSAWKDSCKQRLDEYDSISDCLESNSDIIEEQIKNSKDAVESVNNVMDDFQGFGDQSSRQMISSSINNELTAEEIRLLSEYGSFDAEDARNLIYLNNFNGSIYDSELVELKDDLGLYAEIDMGLRNLTDDTEKRLFIHSKIHETTTTNLAQWGQSEDQQAINYLRDTYGEQVLTTAYQVEEVVRDESNTNFVKFTTYYNGYEKTNLQRILNDDGTPLTVSGKGVFIDGANSIYVVNRGIDFGEQFRKDFSVKPTVEYNEAGHPWIIPLELRGGMFEHSDYANYVHVSFDSSGIPVSYQIWNVGGDGRFDVYKSDNEDRDDVLVMHESGLQSNSVAMAAVERAYNTANVGVSEGDKVPGLDYAASYIASKQQKTSLECMDFMSKGDCDLLFGTCDPVMCPTSRFNLGGHWKVDSVVQTGIIGSIFLGLPNFGPKEPVPICLTGILAGLQNIRSLYEGYNECLNTAKVSGDSVGICNTIRSVYVCEMLWREAISLFNVHGKILNFVSEKIFGKSTGGGEYMMWQSSWNNLQNSVKFFTKDYAQSAFAAYNSRSTEEVGTEVCKSAIFAKAPSVGDLFSQLTEPESPPQFTAWFDELEYTESTQVGFGDRQSIYRIYYHIYAGETQDVRYTVYLKGDNNYNLVVTDPHSMLSRAHIKAGGYADKSFTIPGPSGYAEICVEYNGMTKCGFGKSTSDFSLNYLNDMVVNDEVNRNIDNAGDCVPDAPTTGPSLGSLVTPSNYGLLRAGLMRVCSVINPGSGTNSGDWQIVGNCGSDEIGRSLGYCWLDTSTFQLNDVTKRENVLAQISEEYTNDVSASVGMLSVNDAEIMIDSARQSSGVQNKLSSFREIIFYSNDYVIKEVSNYEIANIYYDSYSSKHGVLYIDSLNCEIEYDFDVRSVLLVGFARDNIYTQCKSDGWNFKWEALFKSSNWPYQYEDRYENIMENCKAKESYSSRWFDADTLKEIIECRFSSYSDYPNSAMLGTDNEDVPFLVNKILPTFSTTGCLNGIIQLVDLVSQSPSDDDELHVRVGNDKTSFSHGDIVNRPRETVNDIINLCT